MNNTALLSSTYFGPVQWYSKLHRYAHCVVDGAEHFVKQTYRNRCVIATANGQQTLSVPVEGFEKGKCCMKDVRISDHGNWRHLHWHALMAAYNESPFFEYYADELHPFFEKKWTFLFDFNEEIRLKMCEWLDIEPRCTHTFSYVEADKTPISSGMPCVLTDENITPCSNKNAPLCEPNIPLCEPNAPIGRALDEHLPAIPTAGGGQMDDYRTLINPKHPGDDAAFVPQPYWQVFAQRQGFMPNLSILDLIFNLGNEAVLWL